MYYVYILLLNNSQLYVGRSDNLKRRFQEHLTEKVKATAKRRPLKLLFYEAFRSKLDTIRRERYLKTTKGKRMIRLMLSDSLKD